MRKNAFCKFLAVLLCTVSLLGIAASGLSIACMTEGKLYSRSVDDMVNDLIRLEGSELAQRLALRYASMELGNVPQSVIENQYPPMYMGNLNDNYRYLILDAQGNPLYGNTPQEGATEYRFPVTGKYMHMVSQMPKQEKFPTLPTDGEHVVVEEDGLFLYNAVPSFGAPVYRFAVTYENGETEDWDYDSGIATIYYTDDAIACLFPNVHQAPRMLNKTITEIMLIGADSELLYHASSSMGVGYFTHYNGDKGILFVSTLAAEAAEGEAVSETTVPETVPETTVPETVPETTVPETTVPKPKIHFTDHIPANGPSEAVKLDAALANGGSVSHEDEGGMGKLTRESDNSIVFTAYENFDAETGAVMRIVFRDASGNVLLEVSGEEPVGELRYNSDHHLTFSFQPPAPEETVPETTAAAVAVETTIETLPEITAVTVPEEMSELIAPPEPTEEPIFVNGKPLREYEVRSLEYFDDDTHEVMYGQYVYAAMPDYTVILYLTPDSLTYRFVYDLLRIVQSYQQYLLPILGASTLIFVLCLVFLFFAAGHSRKQEELRAGGLNRIPLDLYLGCAGLGVPLLAALAFYGGGFLLRQDFLLGCTCAVTCSVAACLLTVGFLFAAAAQFKTPGGYWWRNTLCVRFIRLCVRILVWCKNTILQKWLPWLETRGKSLWKRTCLVLVWFFRKAEKVFLWAGIQLSRLIAWIGNKLHRFLLLLPVTWQWLAIGFVMLVGLFIAFDSQEPNILFLSWCTYTALVVYGAHSFGNLLDAAKHMRQGDLHHKVDDKAMIGSFKEFAEELNALAGVAMLAAQKQLKSERMKSELITNVSHDIKTPLTSIINYVDLLQKPHTEEEGEQYLEVLSRQSQQLKKLIEDLMDMSKASTGNMNVDIGCVDAVESINQALGEFADKLEKVQVVPVFRHSKDSVPMMADGRLVWRVLSNLLGNAVKYAMPGTRLYIDLMELDGNVVISIKNISREELNIDADDLMERFVRGDDSRNTEGSGLGLNIAKSLVELQKGQMQLLVDGDLFKVTLNFPGV